MLARRGRTDAARTGRYRAGDGRRRDKALEVELFGNHAWSEASIRQELDAPARVYVFDVDEADGATRTVNPPSADSPDTGMTATTRDHGHRRQQDPSEAGIAVA